MKGNAGPMSPKNLAYGEGALVILDQTRLPFELSFITARDLGVLIEAISALRIRGAPALGIAAAYGLAVALADHLRRHPDCDLADARRVLADAGAALAASRPTAVNLSRAVEGLLASVALGAADLSSPQELLVRVEQAALGLHEQEAECCERIAAAGLSLLPDPARLLTHCNTGPLATGGIGTALGVILRGHEQGRRFTVYAGETRPLLQGARLTAWELKAAGVPCRLIPDGAGASLILGGKVDAVLVGADRIAANGDTANKVGTLPLALAAARAGVPFYVAAPMSTFDPDCPDASAIPIEERGEEELTFWGGAPLAPPGTRVFNPAFDVTPGALITAFLTERGVLFPPYAFAAADGDFDSTCPQ